MAGPRPQAVGGEASRKSGVSLETGPARGKALQVPVKRGPRTGLVARSSGASGGQSTTVRQSRGQGPGFSPGVALGQPLEGSEQQRAGSTWTGVWQEKKQKSGQVRRLSRPLQGQVMWRESGSGGGVGGICH